ncbi:MAG: SDR family NAD(P)-dependent oxidoreductase [Reichenbachiella sp.]
MKNAIIIGGTSGIGKELSEILAQKEWKVAITGRRENLLQEIKANYPENIITAKHDVDNQKASDEILLSLFEKLETVDLVVVSSGISELNQALDWELENRVIRTNVNGITKIYETIFNKFKEQGFGHLVGITSIAAIRGNRYCPSYSASKAFQCNYLEALRWISKNEKLNIHVTDIQPGFVDTFMAKGDKLFWVVPLPKAGKQIYRAIMRRKRKKIISHRWGIVAFFSRNVPNWLMEKM